MDGLKLLDYGFHLLNFRIKEVWKPPEKLRDLDGICHVQMAESNDGAMSAFSLY